MVNVGWMASLTPTGILPRRVKRISETTECHYAEARVEAAFQGSAGLSKRGLGYGMVLGVEMESNNIPNLCMLNGRLLVSMTVWLTIRHLTNSDCGSESQISSLVTDFDIPDSP